MFNKNEFKCLLMKHGITMDATANLLGINPATLHRKINGHSDFTRQEIQTIRLAFNISDADISAIFFAEQLT